MVYSFWDIAFSPKKATDFDDLEDPLHLLW